MTWFRRKPLQPFFVAGLLLAGCGGEDASRPHQASMPAPALTYEELRRATYQSEWVEGGSVTLTDGTYEDTTQRILITLAEPYASGDLDGDGDADAAVVIGSNTGGSGVFVDLAVVLASPGGPTNVATASLGDRTRVDSLYIEQGRIYADVMQHGPDDPMCCPSDEATRIFTLQDGRLLEESPPETTEAPDVL
jgi:hypothetical protein